MSNIESEFFGLLAKNLPGGTEDKFTALLATTAQLIPEFGSEIRDWIQDESKVPLPPGLYEFRGQVGGLGSSYGGAVIDMVATHEASNTEIWFEHKIGAKENTYENDEGSAGQIEKYVEAAHRKGGRVLIAYCCRDASRIRNRSGLPAADATPVAVLNPTQEAFRWRRLYDRIIDMPEAELDDRQRWLLAQMLAYWRSIPFMWQAAVGRCWKEATIAPKLEAWLHEMWLPIRRLLDERYPGSGMIDSHGRGYYHKPHEGAFVQIHLTQSSAEVFAAPELTTPEVLRCNLKFEVGLPVPQLEGYTTKKTRDASGRPILAVGLPVIDWNPEEKAGRCGEMLRELFEGLLRDLG